MFPVIGRIIKEANSYTIGLPFTVDIISQETLWEDNCWPGWEGAHLAENQSTSSKFRGVHLICWCRVLWAVRAKLLIVVLCLYINEGTVRGVNHRRNFKLSATTPFLSLFSVPIASRKGKGMYVKDCL